MGTKRVTDKAWLRIDLVQQAASSQRTAPRGEVAPACGKCGASSQLFGRKALRASTRPPGGGGCFTVAG